MRVQERTNEITTDAYITITKQSEEKKTEKGQLRMSYWIPEWHTIFFRSQTDGTTYQAHKTYRSEFVTVQCVKRELRNRTHDRSRIANIIY